MSDYIFVLTAGGVLCQQQEVSIVDCRGVTDLRIASHPCPKCCPCILQQAIGEVK